MAVAQALRTLLIAGQFRDVLKLYRELEPTPESRRPDVQLLAATAATRLGDVAAGTSLAEEALTQFRGRGDWDGRMRTLNLLGALHWERGHIADAERCFAEALRLARQLEDSLMLARASNNLASVAHLQGRSDEAAALYRGALLAYQRLGDRRGTAETYHNLGFAYRQSGEWREAEAAAANAVRHAELVGEPGLLALVLGAKAELSIERQDPALAERELERATRYAAEADDPIGQAEVHRVQALSALYKEEWELAVWHAEAARSTALKHDSALLAAEGAGLAARALKGMGRGAEAAERQAEAAAGFRRLGATSLLERLERDLS
ncbi:MAG TPA: tetratricopeptide repeat protein [Gemmatimonadales bacterium]|jgi:tetratricopeptide (TPR) repeat protein|nr:tetratricopeptide repeat protein [Gemmatimonadales bacterium]